MVPVIFEVPAESTGVVHFRASVMNATGIANPDVTVRPLHPVVKFPPGSMGYAELVVSFGENASPHAAHKSEHDHSMPPLSTRSVFSFRTRKL